MALSFAHGAVQWLAADAATTTYAVTGLGFTPKALRLYWTGIASATDLESTTVPLRRGIGVAADATHRRAVCGYSADNTAGSDCGSVAADDCVVVTVDGTGTVDARLDLASLDAGGFTLVVDDQIPSDLTVCWEAWGGTDIATVTVGDIAEPAATGTQNYTATGFTTAGTDQVVLLAGVQSTAALGTGAATDSGIAIGVATGTAATAQWVGAFNSDDASNPTNTDRYVRTGECLAQIVVGGGNPDARASLSAWGTDLFTLDWVARGLTNRRSIYLAIKGGAWAAGSVAIDTRTVGNTATVSGLAFAPVGLLTLSGSTVENGAGTSSTIERAAMGSASSATARRSMGWLDRNGVATTEIFTRVDYDAVVAFTDLGVNNWTLDVSAFTSDGFTLITDENAGGSAPVSTLVPYLACGSALASYTLTAAAASFALTGTTTGVTAQRQLAATQAAFTVTTTAAGLRAGRLLSATTASVSLTGQAAGLLAARTLSAGAGSFALSGTATGLTLARHLTASASAFVLTGVDATLTYSGTTGYTLTASTGTFALTGQAATLAAARLLTAGAGTLTLTGSDAALTAARLLTAGTGAVTLTGADAGLAYGRYLAGATGAVTLTGTAALFLLTRVLGAATGLFALTGVDVVLDYSAVYRGMIRLTARYGATLRLTGARGPAGTFYAANGPAVRLTPREPGA